MGRKKRDLSFEVALSKLAGLKPQALHYQMARLLNELVKGRRLTTDERKSLYHSIYYNDAYRNIDNNLANISAPRYNIKYKDQIIYYHNILSQNGEEGR